LNTGDDEVANGLTLSPLQDLGSKPIISKTLRRINEGISRELKLNIDSLHSRFFGRRRASRDFVGMVLHGQSSEPGLQFALRDAVGYSEVLVEVSCPQKLVVGFVDGVEEIRGYDEDEEAFAIALVAGRSGDGFGVASADEDGVEGRLEIGSCELDMTSVPKA